MSKETQLRIERDVTSSSYPWVVKDKRGRWLKTCRTLGEADEFIAKHELAQPKEGK